MYVGMYVCTYIRICMYVCMYVCTCMHVCLYMCMLYMARHIGYGKGNCKRQCYVAREMDRNVTRTNGQGTNDILGQCTATMMPLSQARYIYTLCQVYIYKPLLSV